MVTHSSNVSDISCIWMYMVTDLGKFDIPKNIQIKVIFKVKQVHNIYIF